MPWPGVLSVGKPSIKKTVQSTDFFLMNVFSRTCAGKNPDPRLFPQEKRETGPH